MRIWKTVGAVVLSALQIVTAAGFVAIGIAKFRDPAWVRHFARWGYPDGFYLVIGALEFAGGLLLFVPRVASYGAALLGAIMIGAAATHAMHGEMARIPAPLVFLTLVAIVGWGRRRRALPLVRRDVAAPGTVVS